MMDRLRRLAMAVFSLVAASALLWGCIIPPDSGEVEVLSDAVAASRAAPEGAEDDEQDDNDDDDSTTPQNAALPVASRAAVVPNAAGDVQVSTDNDGFDTPPTDDDGFDTEANTDHDGVDTTGLLTDNDGTDSDGIDTTGLAHRQRRH